MPPAFPRIPAPRAALAVGEFVLEVEARPGAEAPASPATPETTNPPKPFAGLTQKPPCEGAHPLPELAAPELSRRVVVPAGFRATPLLTAQEEKQQRQQRADQQARGQGEIEGKVAALDEDVAGQAPEPGDPPPFQG